MEDQDDIIYATVDEFLSGEEDRIKKMILNLYRSDESLEGHLDAHALRSLLKLAFEAGRHSGASNSYC